MQNTYLCTNGCTLPSPSPFASSSSSHFFSIAVHFCFLAISVTTKRFAHIIWLANATAAKKSLQVDSNLGETTLLLLPFRVIRVIEPPCGLHHNVSLICVGNCRRRYLFIPFNLLVHIHFGGYELSEWGPGPPITRGKFTFIFCS